MMTASSPGFDVTCVRDMAPATSSRDDIEELSRHAEAHECADVVGVEMKRERSARVVERELVVMHVERRRAELHLLGHLAVRRRNVTCAPGPGPTKRAEFRAGRGTCEPPREHGVRPEEHVRKEHRLRRNHVRGGNRDVALHPLRDRHAILERRLKRDVHAHDSRLERQRLRGLIGPVAELGLARDDVERRGELALAGDHEALCIRTNGHFLVTDRRSAQEDRVAHRRFGAGWRRLGPLRCRGERQEQRERQQYNGKRASLLNRIS